MTDAENMIDRIFRLTPAIRYVALYLDGNLTSRQTPDAAQPSGAESDRYEELFVNPALLTIVRQRGDLDCGGTRYILVRYGNFFQLVMDVPGGHVSVCFEPTSNPLDYTGIIYALFSLS